MKNLIILLTAITILYACTTPKEITKEQSEKIFTHEVIRSADEIRIKVLTYVNEAFYSGEAVIQTQDQGIITGNYRFYCDKFDPMGMLEVWATATFIVKYYDQFYKTKYVLKNMETVSSEGIVALDLSYWGNYADEIDDNFNQFDSTLFNYIISYDTF